MLIYVVEDRTFPNDRWTYAIGPGVDIFAAQSQEPNLLNPVYKTIPAAGVPILEITEWPLNYGVLQRTPPEGTHLTMLIHDSWTGKRSTYSFLDGQLGLKRRAEALRNMYDQAALLSTAPPKWVQRVGDLFGLP